MIVLAARYYCKPGQGDAVAAALQEMTPLVRQEPGLKLYLVSRARENSDLFLLYELYRDEAAVQAHRETPHFKRIIEGTIMPLLERREREFFNLLEEPTGGG